MYKEIIAEDIIDFQNKYESKQENKFIEQKIRSKGIKKASVNEEYRSKFEFKFNIEVPDRKIYDQRNSYQCNIYAFLRVVSDIIRKNSDLNIDDISLSSNYINFFDKLEKVNVVYNNLIESDNLSIEKINKEADRYIGSFGTFHFCREIVNKYGLVPETKMKEVNCNYDDFLTNELLKAKVKTDASALIKIESKSDRYKIKRQLMSEIYEFLSKVLGSPPKEFNFEGNKITPLEFRDKYLNTTLNDYVTVTSFNKDMLLDSYSFISNIYLNNSEKIISLPVEKMKKAVITQLKHGISVWFSSEESTTLDYNYNILDNDLYDYYNLLSIKNISKKDKLLLNLINYDHAMSITGALIENGEVKQFKVDNSFGKHGEFDGRVIMTKSFFENSVITVILNKKYIEDKDRN